MKNLIRWYQTNYGYEEFTVEEFISLCEENNLKFTKKDKSILKKYFINFYAYGYKYNTVYNGNTISKIDKYIKELERIYYELSNIDNI